MIGHGRMGLAVDAEARLRQHERTAAVTSADVNGAGAGALDLGGAEVAFEFTHARVAEENVISLLDAGLTVICGTTGWQPGPAVAAAVERTTGALVVAPNFSIGVQLFFALAETAARSIAAVGSYEASVVESHHSGKLDAPSGTARRLARIVIDNDPELEGLQEEPGPRASGLLPVLSVRAGHDPGTHEVAFDGLHDRISLRHVARSRRGFALGAVLAAEWVLGRRGQYGFEALLREQIGETY
jgi:4-hydroxy-tetrahydrodipicolinate reductase